MNNSHPSILTDVLIIGSGPIGATYARMIAENRPDINITMLDAGPKISDKIGQHVKNITDPQALEQAQVLSQGPQKEAYPMVSVAARAEAVQHGDLRPELLARAGTHLVTDTLETLRANEMPAISMSTNLGGMGVHWTCACPRPGNTERIPFIPAQEMDDVLTKAEKILHVTQTAFSQTGVGEHILSVLNQTLGENHSENRQAQPMPLACTVDAQGQRYWSASDTILGDTITQANFTLRAETIARKLIQHDNRIVGAEVEHLPTGQKELIEAKIIIVAADSLRTPQLLWASGIRPKALGRYLNEHPFIFTFVELDAKILKAHQQETALDNTPSADPTIGVFWVPFDAPNHPFHGQIMHIDLSPMKTVVDENAKHIVGLGWGCLKEVSADDQIVFSETEKDFMGMPKMTFKYQFSEKDLQAIEDAKAFQAKVVASFGKTIHEGQQTVMPAGSALHYEGSTRMGETNDGTSVCDSYSKVWELDNLYVGGNGVIPMATTSNPTLTSVALAIRSCESILKNW